MDQRHILKEGKKAAKPCSCLLWTSMLLHDVLCIKMNNFRDRHFGWIAATLRRLVLLGDVSGENPLSSFSFACAAASAPFDLAVSNDPHCWFSTVRGLKPKTRSFTSLRHFSLIALIAL